MGDKPADLFDRDQEWTDLERFVTTAGPGIRVGVVYGRRRLGKSFLLRRLVREHGGIYHQALEESAVPALQRFADSVGAGRGLEAGQLRMRDWAEAIRMAVSGTERLVVIDEFPYLLAHPLGASLPSVLQALVDESRSDAAARPVRVIVCGSALSVMVDMLSGGRALRGRAQLDLRLRPFDYRQAAEYYGIDDPEVAFHLYAILGGVAGYRDLIAEASPRTLNELDELILDTVGNPSHALFGEPGYLLREDPRIMDRSLYYSILNAIASGATTPAKIAAALGRDARGLAHPLEVLLSAGFIRKDDDVLLQRRPTLTVSDPIVRFHDLVVSPRLAAFEERRAHSAWKDAQASVRTQILGPAFEDLAREWLTRYSAASLDGSIGEVGTTVLNDSRQRTQHQIDIIALAPGQRRQTRRPSIRVLGEAKDSDRLRSTADLTRLERIRNDLVSHGRAEGPATLFLFGRSGFDDDLVEVARRRADVELVDLERIRYGS